LLFVDHDDAGAPADARDPSARALRAALLAVVPMLVVAPTFAVFLAGEGVARAPLSAGVAAVAVGQLVVVLVTRWGLRHRGPAARTALGVVSTVIGATLVMFALTPVLLESPVGSDHLGYAYQLWIAGCTAAAMAIAGASRTMFVAASVVPLAVNAVVVAAGWSGVPRSFVVIVGLYLVVLAVSQTAQQHAVEQALANGDHAHRLLDELREANANLSYEASHDMLTGIANRRRVLAVLADELTRVGRGSELAVLFLDLDGFKEINDTYGHATGDQLLVAAAARITELVGDGDHVGRQGGDEFIVLVRSCRGAEVLALAERIRSALETSFRVGEHLLAVSASIGVVVCDRPGIAPDDVLRDADLALYRAKDLGRNCVAEHRRHGAVAVDERPRSVGELRSALQDRSIRAYYQPIVDLDTGAIVGAEALVRWEQPDGSVLLPGQFLRAVVEAGLDTDLGIHMALQLMELRSEIAPLVPESFRVGLNVTLRRTRAKDLVDSLLVMRSMTTLTGRPVIEGIAIELNENAAVRDIDETSVELARARAGGLSVALDDFGTGHSSLTLVRRLPLDVIKVDREFVDGVADDRANQAVVSAIVELARGIDARVVAEGVERAADVERLRALGCRLAQGFHFAPAVPGPTLRDWLQHGAPWQPYVPDDLPTVDEHAPVGVRSR
jgi:diguanylate cyclase (GGDEF)-like protein